MQLIIKHQKLNTFLGGSTYRLIRKEEHLSVILYVSLTALNGSITTACTAHASPTICRFLIHLPFSPYRTSRKPKTQDRGLLPTPSQPSTLDRSKRINLPNPSILGRAAPSAGANKRGSLLTTIGSWIESLSTPYPPFGPVPLTDTEDSCLFPSFMKTKMNKIPIIVVYIVSKWYNINIEKILQAKEKRNSKSKFKGGKEKQ